MHRTRPPWSRTNTLTNSRNSALYGMVDNLDVNIGRILDKLKEWKIEEDTLVIFMTDNGPNSFRYNSGMRGRKAHYDDGGVRVPFLMRWPGTLKTGGLVERRLAHIDVLPTLAELCGLEGTDSMEMDGLSFAPLLTEPFADWPDRMLYTFPFGDLENFGNVGAVRTDQWIAVRRRGGWFLYDLLKDPRQSPDLAEQHPWVLDSLVKQYETTYSEIASRVDFNQAPIPFGYDEAPSIILEAHDAILINRDQGGIDYNFPAGYAHHWITDWTNLAAYPEWPLQCVQAGEYEVDLQYCMKSGNEGAEYLIVIEDQVLETTIDKAYEPESYSQPFRLPGEASKYESKPWRFHNAGKVTLPEGTFMARIRLLKFPGEQGAEIKGLRIRKM